jgi:hypothetical protein
MTGDSHANDTGPIRRIGAESLRHAEHGAQTSGPRRSRLQGCRRVRHHWSPRVDLFGVILPVVGRDKCRPLYTLLVMLLGGGPRPPTQSDAAHAGAGPPRGNGDVYRASDSMPKKPTLIAGKPENLRATAYVSPRATTVDRPLRVRAPFLGRTKVC